MTTGVAYLILELPVKPTSDDAIELSRIMAEFKMRWWTTQAVIMGTANNIRLLYDVLKMEPSSANFDSGLRFDIALALEDTQILAGEGESDVSD